MNLRSVSLIHKSAYSTLCLRISWERHQIIKKSLTSDPQTYMLPHFQEAFAHDGFQLSLQSRFDLLITQIHEANWIIHQSSVKRRKIEGETLPEFVHINRPFYDKLRLLWQIDLVIKSLILERPQFFTLILHDLAIYSQFVPETGVEEIFVFREIYEFLAWRKKFQCCTKQDCHLLWRNDYIWDLTCDTKCKL
jgi:hypothetical protein